MEALLMLVAVKLGIVALGGILVFLSLKAYRKQRDRSTFFLCLGFSLITLGSLAEGVLFEFYGFELLEVHIVESLIVLAGFISLIYSIYGFD